MKTSKSSVNFIYLGVNWSRLYMNPIDIFCAPARADLASARYGLFFVHFFNHIDYNSERDPYFPDNPLGDLATAGAVMDPSYLADVSGNLATGLVFFGIHLFIYSHLLQIGISTNTPPLMHLVL
jgi:hypothetical protein